MTTFQFFEVGGAVRDSFMGVESKDVDFAVVADTTSTSAEVVFAEMVSFLESTGFTVFVSNPEFLTVRARVPAGHPLESRTNVADFVLARVDGPTVDGRRPSFVSPGTLMDDLARRDFTVNAMARTESGEVVDPFGGQADLEAQVLRFVGEPMERVREDGLRVMRAFRFMVTKGFTAAPETWAAVTSAEAAAMMSSVSAERMREEMERMFAANTPATLALFAALPAETVAAMFPEGLRLSATMRA